MGTGFGARRGKAQLPTLVEFAALLVEYLRRAVVSLAAIPRSTRSTSIFAVGTILINALIVVSLLTVIEVNVVSLPAPIQWYKGGDARLNQLALRGATTLAEHRLQRRIDPHDRVVSWSRPPHSAADGGGGGPSSGSDALGGGNSSAGGYTALFSTDNAEAPQHRRRIVSPSGRYVAQLQPSGNLVVLDSMQVSGGECARARSLSAPVRKRASTLTPSFPIPRRSPLFSSLPPSLGQSSSGPAGQRSTHGAAWRSKYGAANRHDDVVGSTVLWASGRMATRNGCPCRLTVDGSSAEITVIGTFLYLPFHFTRSMLTI
jgi:hypothetical protein